MSTARARSALALLVAALVGCGDESATTTTTTMAAATSNSADGGAGDGAVEAAFEFAQCMRASGIEDFADPQVRSDGDFFLSPPADVDDDELQAADEACEHIASAFRNDAGTVANPADDAAGWERIVPGGDCRCSDGSEFSFWVREASPDKVLFYLQDGGVCFDAATCADTDEYNTTVDQGPAGAGGIFEFADERNPFADHSVVYVPYCTGDVHLGTTTTEYAPGLTVHHDGYVNGIAALDHMAANASSATDIVVVGESAGSIAAPLYAGLASERLPGARITVLADGSGSYPDARRLNEIIAGWGFTSPWPDGANPATGQWSFPGLFIESARHDPEIVFARHDYADDDTQRSWLRVAGLPDTDLLSLIDSNEAQIEAAGVNLLSYIAPGNEHTALSDGTFYTEQVNGQPLLDWVTELIEGEPVDDVHCSDCTAG